MKVSRQDRWKVSMAVLGVVLAAALVMVLPSRGAAGRMIILGIDGLDPRLLNRYMEEGILPNFEQVVAKGDYKPLQTTMPPLSPVAWSSFITGMDPGGHGIYDFLHRKEGTMLPRLSMSQALPPTRQLEIGSWVLPLDGGEVQLLRQGRAFWQILDEHEIPATIFRMPANFPPAPSEAKTFSGMGTPDILGTPGTFSFYTNHPPENATDISGGQVFRVQVVNNRIRAELRGPENTFRREKRSRGDYSHPDLEQEFRVFLDPENGVAKLEVEDQEFILREGEWSDWVPVRFEAVPYLVEVEAVCRFYLQQLTPDFRLYVSPLQISPANPAMPLSTPADWSSQLFEELGYFYTQELPEDTKAFSAGILSGEEFWTQAQSVYRERRRALDYFLDEFDQGLLFFYFSSVDQGCHMLWQYLDEEHPLYQPHPQLGRGVETLYREMDEALGRVLEEVDENTTLVVMSDHGFSPFYRGVNLNSWLLEQGYVTLKDPSKRGQSPLFRNVDWSKTRAYALGLNGVYVNLRGREPNGIVAPGAEEQRLLDELERDLLAMTDDDTGADVVSLVIQSKRDFQGPYREAGPDIVVGYDWGYRTSWKSPLGEFPEDVFLDNDDAWSGDHSIDYRLVPGVLISNKKIILEKPALHDLTVGVLDEFGLGKLPEMIGQDCLGQERLDIKR